MTTVLEQAHSTLRRFGDEVKGYKVEILRGHIMMGPVRPVHNSTIRRVWNAFEEQVGVEWGFISDVGSEFTDADTELCPDLAILPKEEEVKNLSKYSPELFEVVVEVISPGSILRDYDVKAEFYANAGIPFYVILGPYEAQCTWMSTPEAGRYTDRGRCGYGGEVILATPVGDLRLDTSKLPTDPGI